MESSDDFDPTHDLGPIPLELTGRDYGDQLTENFVDYRGREYRLPEGVADRRRPQPQPGEVWQDLMLNRQTVDHAGRLVDLKTGEVVWSPGDAHLDEHERITARYRRNNP